MSKAPTFQHRQYVAIAAMMSKRPSHAPSLRAANESMITALCELFASDNGAFDSNRFRSACAGTPINGRDKPKGKFAQFDTDENGDPVDSMGNSVL